MASGLPASTMISSVLVANVAGSPAVPSPLASLSMFAESADANTSAGAPSLIWPTRSDDAAKLNVMSTSGFAAVNASPSDVNASVSEAAANTVSAPDTVLDVGSLGDGVDAVAVADVTLATARTASVGMNDIDRLMGCSLL